MDVKDIDMADIRWVFLAAGKLGYTESFYLMVGMLLNIWLVKCFVLDMLRESDYLQVRDTNIEQVIDLKR